MKRFKTTGLCNPNKDYMVDITERLVKIKAMVDYGDYFTINRARQFGKTTTLAALERFLSDNYHIIKIDFQAIGASDFADEKTYVKSFIRLLLEKNDEIKIPDEILNKFTEILNRKKNMARLGELFIVISQWCKSSDKPLVLIIDEVDSASNNQVFLDFLAQLRLQYLNREENPEKPAFQSVILAGVTDIKHLKSKIRDEDQTKVNSPWNIAADFDIDMTLSADGIKGMLDDYEADHHTGMDTKAIADRIYEYTFGYPFLVSRICQLIDEKLVPGKIETLEKAWTDNGFDEAIKLLLSEDNSLFDSLMGKLTNYPLLREKLKGILLRGNTLEYLPDDEAQKQLRMYGFVRNYHNTCVVFNRIFEMRLYKQFLGESKYDDLKQLGSSEKSVFIENGELNVPKIMQHFIDSQIIIHDKYSEKFAEEEGRERFLTYLSPIINGVGTYSIEEQTRDHRRMDVVIHYLGRRYVIELKIWRGERYNKKGEEQLRGYLDFFGLDVGYMLSFNFNKKKEVGVQIVKVGNKTLYEGTL